MWYKSRMGWTRIRSKHVRWAGDDTYYNKVKALLAGADTAEEIIARCEQEARRLGLRVVKKDSSSMKWSKMTTTWYREIRLGSDFDDEPEWARAVIWAHEMVHVYQWRGMGRARFASRYAWRLWRWAIEIQAYRMSVHIRKVLKIRKSWTERYIRDRPYRLKAVYLLGGLRWSHLRNKTRSVLTHELKKAI